MKRNNVEDIFDSKGHTLWLDEVNFIDIYGIFRYLIFPRTEKCRVVCDTSNFTVGVSPSSSRDNQIFAMLTR